MKRMSEGLKVGLVITAILGGVIISLAVSERVPPVPDDWQDRAAEEQCGPINWDNGNFGLEEYAIGPDGKNHAVIWYYEAKDGRMVAVYGGLNREDPMDVSSPLYYYLEGVECDA